MNLRESARLIWEAALSAANPATCITKFIQKNESIFRYDGRLIVIGAGKADAKMAQVIEEIFGDRITSGLVVTKYGHALPLRHIRLVEAGHPLPDAAGLRAVEETRKLLQGLSSNDMVLCLISGGGSALWPSPAEGVTLEEKQEVTHLLLRAGTTIRELNAVRKHLSGMKGGQLARWASPARMVSLIMSDVIGDPIDFIASGPGAPDTTSFSEALDIIDKYRVDAPQSVLRRFREGVAGRIPDTPKSGDKVFERIENHIIANNRLLVDAAVEKANELRLNTLVLSTEIEGEAWEAGGFFASIAREIENSGNPIKSPACVLAAGETTVTVRGNGAGGRNQEMALAWAIAMAQSRTPVASCFASVATDGSDGPTTAAGGLVDGLTVKRGADLGLSASKYLQNNDSWNFLNATGDLIVTGPTQTNLMDLQILLVGDAGDLVSG